MRHERHHFDFCVVGAGMAGICAALAAARKGVRTALVHDRPVLGGNSSSEIRVHICGADRHNGIKNMRETGLLEELRLDNVRTNPHKNFHLWDLVLYNKVRYQDNLSLFSNCSVNQAQMDGDKIASLTGWQTTTETFHQIDADLFADCSGDGILAPLTGADFRIGREGRHEYGESVAPEMPDCKTMGMTIWFHALDTGRPQTFVPPSWAHSFPDDSAFPHRDHSYNWKNGYWWIELGGEHDPIGDTERIRDELLRIMFGVWDHIKNRGEHGAENWELTWFNFLPGKRESRRYIGDHVLNQGDLEAGGKFEDTVAYGGWSMDDHAPGGFRWSGSPTTYYPCPSPYGIPYRCLYSRNIANLFCAGRCHSATHAAMSSTRVQGTGAAMGQAVGAAAAIACSAGASPREVAERHVAALQQGLLEDDCYLPGVVRRIDDTTRDAKLSATSGDAEPLRNGVDRPVGDDLHAWEGSVGDTIEFTFGRLAEIPAVTAVLDSALDHDISLSVARIAEKSLTTVPDVMVKDFRIEVRHKGQWGVVRTVRDNHQRLVEVPIGCRAEGLRFVPEATWGSDRVRLYALDMRG